MRYDSSEKLILAPTDLSDHLGGNAEIPVRYSLGTQVLSGTRYEIF